MLRQRLVRILKADDSSCRFMASMLHKHRMGGGNQHRAVLAIVARVERHTEDEAVGFDGVLVDGTPEP